MKLSKYNPAPEDWSPKDAPDAVFELVALPGIKLFAFNDLCASGKVEEAARGVILAGIKSVSGLEDGAGKPVTNARELWAALRAGDAQAAGLLHMLVIEIVVKSTLTEGTVKN